MLHLLSPFHVEICTKSRGKKRSKIICVAHIMTMIHGNIHIQQPAENRELLSADFIERQEVSPR